MNTNILHSWQPTIITFFILATIVLLTYLSHEKNSKLQSICIENNNTVIHCYIHQMKDQE